MVNARLCEMARLELFFACARHFDFLDCKTETSKGFWVRARDVQTLKLWAPDLVESYENELEWTCSKDLVSKSILLLKTLVRNIRSENLSTVNKFNFFPGHELISGQEVALGRFPLIFLTDALSLSTQFVWKSSERRRGRVWTQWGVSVQNNGGKRTGHKVLFRQFHKRQEISSPTSWISS